MHNSSREEEKKIKKEGEVRFQIFKIWREKKLWWKKVPQLLEKNYYILRIT